MEDTLTIKLRKPIEVGTHRVDEITLSEPTFVQVRDARDAAGSDTSKSMALIASVTGLPVAVIEQLPFSAARKADNFLSGFINDAGV